MYNDIKIKKRGGLSGKKEGKKEKIVYHQLSSNSLFFYFFKLPIISFINSNFS